MVETKILVKIPSLSIKISNNLVKISYILAQPFWSKFRKFSQNFLHFHEKRKYFD